MPKISVILHPPLDQVSGLNKGGSIVEGVTVLDALQRLTSRLPKLADVLFEDDNISPFIHIFYNGKEVNPQHCSIQRIQDGGEVELLTAIRGG